MRCKSFIGGYQLKGRSWTYPTTLCKWAGINKKSSALISPRLPLLKLRFDIYTTIPYIIYPQHILYIALDDSLISHQSIVEIVDEYRKTVRLKFEKKEYLFLDEITCKNDYEPFYLRKNSDSDCIPRMRISTSEAKTWSKSGGKRMPFNVAVSKLGQSITSQF